MTLDERVEHRLSLDTVAQPLKSMALSLRTDLVDVQPVFSKEPLQTASTVIDGLGTHGSYEKPERDVPLVLLCTPSSLNEMQALVDGLKRRRAKFRGQVDRRAAVGDARR